MGYVSLRADRIPDVKQVRNELQTLSATYECTAHAYISMSELSGGYGRHNDDSEVWSWQCHGYSNWHIEDPKGHYEVTMEPGSWLYVPSKMWHRVVPLGARAGISFALEEGKPMRWVDGRRVGVWGTTV
jgi:ribosomal protein L16 Arg81 hydroxylase